MDAIGRVMVLDASAAAEFLLDTPTGRSVAEWIARAGTPAHAPHLLDIEVVNALRRWVRLGQMGARRAGEALEDLKNLAMIRHPQDLLLPRIRGMRSHASAYDAAYLALAEVLGATLVTCDRRMAGVPGCHASVDIV